MICENCVRLEAQAAVMREALAFAVRCAEGDERDYRGKLVPMMKKALSSDAGKELLAKLERLEKALQAHEEFAATDTGPFLPTKALLEWLAKWAEEGETANVALARLRREALCSPE